MIIKGFKKGSVYSKGLNNFFRKYIFRKGFILLLLVAFAISGYMGSKYIRTKGYTGLWDFVKTVSSNYFQGLKANPEVVSIEIKEKDFKFLQKNRERALERTVIINDIDGDYVPATLEYQGKKLNIKLRLKGHMTDHLQDNKWSFRVKVKDTDSFMGMKRFSLQHPGTRGYIYEWIYHQLMKREDIIALRYKFITITVNGRDWGIYAVEESFDDELIENNNRKRGPIFRFNPDLYWVDRYNEIIHSQPVAEFASYSSAPIEAFREDKVLKDSIQHEYYLKAIALMEGFRSRKLSVDKVFDIERMARFHAIIDLVGGQHSIDWSDIKYYYNPVTAKIEPISYESFTNFPFEDIIGNYRYTELDSNQNFEDIHAALFSDPQFFKAYIKQLERVIEPSYLDKFFNESNEELKKNLTILYNEFPYKKFDKQDYYKNQLMIKQLLSAPKSIHAYYNNIKNNQIHLQIGAIESLPVEIRSVSIGNDMGLPAIPIVLPAKQKNQYVNYKDYCFSMPAVVNWNDSLIATLKVNYSILGSEKVQQAKVFPFPHTDSEFIASDLKNKQSNVKNFPFLIVDNDKKVIVIKQGKQIIDMDMVIPPGYRLVANSGVYIDLKNNAKIISYSPIIFIGTEDNPITVESSDSTAQGIELIDAEKSVFNYIIFKNLPKVHDQQWARSGAITFYESPVEFNYCNFYNSKAENGVNLMRSKFSFKECIFHRMYRDALDADFSEGTITNCVFEQCNENALNLTMCEVKIKSIYVDGCKDKAFNIKGGAQLKGDDVRIKNSNIAISAEDLSSIDLQNVTITNSEIGLVAYRNNSGAGYPTLNVSGLVLSNVKKNYLREKKSTITANGVTISDEVDNVGINIKNEKK
jgi:hypothetical protein